MLHTRPCFLSHVPPMLPAFPSRPCILVLLLWPPILYLRPYMLPYISHCLVPLFVNLTFKFVDIFKQNIFLPPYYGMSRTIPPFPPLIDNILQHSFTFVKTFFKKILVQFKWFFIVLKKIIKKIHPATKKRRRSRAPLGNIKSERQK